MAYKVDNNMWNGGGFAVPSDLVDKHIKLCGAASLKVLLILLRQQGGATPQRLSEMLSLPLADVQDAMNYWVHLGVIRDEESPAMQPEAVPEPARPVAEAAKPAAVKRAPEAPKAPAKQKPGASRPRLSTGQINEMSRSDKNIGLLLQEAQGVLGKPLTPVVTETIAGLYSYHGMQPDLILMLLQYCLSIGKDSMNYVNRVAAAWLEKGIDTHEKAEQELLRAAQRDDTEGKIKSIFGIWDRDLVKSERAFVETWVEQFGMPMDVIQMAHERTVEMTGKLSFQYTNGILKNWAEKGVNSTKMAAQEIARGRGETRGGAKKKGSDASYDINELDNLFTYGKI